MNVVGFFVDGKPFVEETYSDGTSCYRPYNPYDLNTEPKGGKPMKNEKNDTNETVEKEGIEFERDYIVESMFGSVSRRFGSGEALLKRSDKPDAWTETLYDILKKNGARVSKIRFTDSVTGETIVNEYVYAWLGFKGFTPYKYGDFCEMRLLISKDSNCWYRIIYDTDTALVINSEIFEKKFASSHEDTLYVLNGVKKDGFGVSVAVKVILKSDC